MTTDTEPPSRHERWKRRATLFPTIANRLGRIALASVLAGYCLTLVFLFIETVRGTWHESGLDTVLVFVTLWIVAAVVGSVAVGVFLVFKWTVTRSISATRFWQVVLSLLVLGVAGATWVGGGPLTVRGFVLPLLTLLAYPLGGLAGIALSEGLFSSGLHERATVEDATTVIGVAVVLAAVLVAGTVGVGSVVATMAGTTDVPSTLDGRESTHEFVGTYGHLEGTESGDALLCEPDSDPREIPDPVAETHETGFGTFTVEADFVYRDGDVHKPVDLELAIESEGQIERVVTIHNDGDRRTGGPTVRDYEVDDGEPFALMNSHKYWFADYRLADYTLEIYVHTDDGEVVRYVGEVCPDGESDG